MPGKIVGIDLRQLQNSAECADLQFVVQRDDCPHLTAGIAFDIRTRLPVRPLTTNPYCFESIFITVSPDTGLSPGTLGHLERRDDRPSPVFQREFF